MSSTKRKAVVLLSGGLDSAVVAAMAADDGFELHALTVQYGQRHGVEIEASRRVARHIGVARHIVQDVDLRTFGGSALTDRIDVPKSDDNCSTPGIPVTYVPARNTILLSLALAFAESIASTDIFIGVNAVDYSGYPDCRPEFVSAFERLANVATKIGVEGATIKIRAPLIALSKSDIITEAARLGVDLSLTHSCYDPSQSGKACGRCESCRLRRQGFKLAGVSDPTRYQTRESVD